MPVKLRVLADPVHYRLLWRTFRDIRYIGMREFFRRGRRYLIHLLSDPGPDLPRLEEGLSWMRNEPMVPGKLADPVDIVMPVYNGYEHLRRAVESVLAHSEGPYRLLLCDDGSEDPKVRTYLAGLEQRWPQVSVFRSPKNRGFVANVNAAMKHVRHHFVLLNQDTEVPPGWLPRLLAPLLADPASVASVTPLSNAAGPCSFPRILEDNPLYEGLGVTELDQFFQRVEPRTVETPTGVGFCMVFNRRVVERIGLFDPAFGHGYGEENDWCRRAANLGYRNLIVPNLLVYHAHGAIFGPRKQVLLRNNQALLYRRHPDYPSCIDTFLRADPLAPLRVLLPMIIRAAGRAGCSLWVDHSLGGGANLYRRQRQREEIERGLGVLTLTWCPGRREYELEYHDLNAHFRFRLDDPKCLQELAVHLPLRRIHVNNLAGYPDPVALLPLLTEMSRRHDVAMTAYLHDYFPLCPRYTLLNDRGEYCGLPDLGVCRPCLASGEGGYDIHFRRPVRDLSSWRRHWEAFLGSCDRVVAFSRTSETLLLGQWPRLQVRMRVRPHQVAPMALTLPEKTAAIGVVGRISPAKGLPVLREMGHILRRRGSRLKIVLIGEATGSLDPGVFEVTGPYRREEMPELAARHRLALFFVPSLWPETFCYTAEEVMKMGGYLAVFGLGAQAERVREYGRGKVLQSMAPLAVLEEIVEWGKELELWDETILGTDPL